MNIVLRLICSELISVYMAKVMSVILILHVLLHITSAIIEAKYNLFLGKNEHGLELDL